MNILNYFKKLSLKRTPIIFERYYDSIDEMSLNAWIKCNNDDLRYTRRTLTEGTEEEDSKQWEVLQNQYLERFGLPEDYEKYLRLQVSKAKAQLEYVITGKRFELNKITAIDFKINAMTNENSNEITIQKMLNHLSKMQGYTLTQFNTTVSQYFELIDTLQKQK
jgi:hypothetical protein